MNLEKRETRMASRKERVSRGVSTGGERREERGERGERREAQS